MKRYGYHRTSTREVLQNIGIPATRLQSQTVCTPCLNLMIADVSNMSKLMEQYKLVCRKSMTISYSL